jgi:hypothetical protein
VEFWVKVDICASLLPEFELGMEPELEREASWSDEDLMNVPDVFEDAPGKKFAGGTGELETERKGEALGIWFWFFWCCVELLDSLDLIEPLFLEKIAGFTGLWIPSNDLRDFMAGVPGPVPAWLGWIFCCCCLCDALVLMNPERLKGLFVPKSIVFCWDCCWVSASDAFELVFAPFGSELFKMGRWGTKGCRALITVDNEEGMMEVKNKMRAS